MGCCLDVEVRVGLEGSTVLVLGAFNADEIHRVFLDTHKPHFKSRHDARDNLSNSRYAVISSAFDFRGGWCSDLPKLHFGSLTEPESAWPCAIFSRGSDCQAKGLSGRRVFSFKSTHVLQRIRHFREPEMRPS
jgi:hypothetical protein